MLNFIENYFAFKLEHTHVDTQVTSVHIKIRKGHCEDACNNHKAF